MLLRPRLLSGSCLKLAHTVSAAVLARDDWSWGWLALIHFATQLLLRSVRGLSGCRSRWLSS